MNRKTASPCLDRFGNRVSAGWLSAAAADQWLELLSVAVLKWLLDKHQADGSIRPPSDPRSAGYLA
jgi:hypothetical protein